MNPIKQAQFLASHVDAKYYEADKQLYVKMFPDNPLVNDLDSILPFQKAEFDERIVREIIKAQDGDKKLFDNRKKLLQSKETDKLTAKELNKKTKKELIDLIKSDNTLNGITASDKDTKKLIIEEILKAKANDKNKPHTQNDTQGTENKSGGDIKNAEDNTENAKGGAKEEVKDSQDNNKKKEPQG